jgi:hypothetical protein
MLARRAESMELAFGAADVVRMGRLHGAASPRDALRLSQNRGLVHSNDGDGRGAQARCKRGHRYWRATTRDDSTVRWLEQLAPDGLRAQRRLDRRVRVGARRSVVWAKWLSGGGVCSRNESAIISCAGCTTLGRRRRGPVRRCPALIEDERHSDVGRCSLATSSGEPAPGEVLPPSLRRLIVGGAASPGCDARTGIGRTTASATSRAFSYCWLLAVPALARAFRSGLSR